MNNRNDTEQLPALPPEMWDYIFRKGLQADKNKKDTTLFLRHFSLLSKSHWEISSHAVFKAYMAAFDDPQRLDQIVTEYFIADSGKCQWTTAQIEFLSTHPNFCPDLYLFLESSSVPNRPKRRNNGDIYCYRNFNPRNDECLTMMDNKLSSTNLHAYSCYAIPLVIIAVKNKKTSGLEIMLNAKADIRAKSWLYSAHRLYEHISGSLKYNNCSIRISQSEYYDSFYYDLLARDDVGSIQVVIKLNPGFIDTQLPYGSGETPLEFAINIGKKNIAEFLLNLSAPFNKDKVHLRNLARTGLSSLMRKLIHVGVDINQVDHKNENALHEAIIWKQFELVKYLIKVGARFSEVKNNWSNEKAVRELVAAVSFCDAETLEIIILEYKKQQSTNISEMLTVVTGNTLLHEAILYKNTAAIVYLLKNTNISLNTKNLDGHTVIDYAKIHHVDDLFEEKQMSLIRAKR